MEKFDLIILGNGISAKMLLFELLRSKEPLKIAQISNEEMAPSCSHHTTSIVSAFGARKGISDLGDLCVDSVNALKGFVAKYAPLGIEPAVQYHLDPEGPSTLVRRFSSALLVDKIAGRNLPKKSFMAQEESFVIYPHIFLPWLDNKIKDERVLKKNTFIKEFEKSSDGHYLSDGHFKYFSKNVVLCTGAYTKIFENIFPDFEHINGSKVVAGSYIEFSNVDWGDKDLIFSLKKQNLIYRHLDKKLLLGGTSSPEGISLVYARQLKEAYEYYQEVLGQSFFWPKFRDGSYNSGLRHKGKKRRPFYGEIERGLYAQIGLYKNGFSYPFYTSPILSQNIIKDIGNGVSSQR